MAILTHQAIAAIAAIAASADPERDGAMVAPSR